ncbi:hypothetical protein M2262_000751 [Pseudomonas sp. BIGb0408]|uniref:Uncharacterized protein n=1 Tax=Phytopseudomonas flavescens TaxID=29435 RepID=A0A7Y9XNN0_9GAMM|nr:hypothetical protein [Pseudomonas sp. BIGb0408]NYH74726.1 hypothetical protein [Pseudomonas flavescens]
MGQQLVGAGHARESPSAATHGLRLDIAPRRLPSIQGCPPGPLHNDSVRPPEGASGVCLMYCVEFRGGQASRCPPYLLPAVGAMGVEIVGAPPVGAGHARESPSAATHGLRLDIAPRSRPSIQGCPPGPLHNDSVRPPEGASGVCLMYCVEFLGGQASRCPPYLLPAVGAAGVEIVGAPPVGAGHSRESPSAATHGLRLDIAPRSRPSIQGCPPGPLHNDSVRPPEGASGVCPMYCVEFRGGQASRCPPYLPANAVRGSGPCPRTDLPTTNPSCGR